MTNIAETTGANPASLLMSSSFIAELITLNNPEELARHLCEQLRRISGAQTVACFFHSEPSAKCLPLYTCPEDRIGPLGKNGLSGLCPMCHPGQLPLNVADIPENNPLSKALEDSRVHRLLRILVNSSGTRPCAFVFLDLPNTQCSEEMMSALDFLGPIIGPALQNSIIRQENDQLKELAEKHTAELEIANRELAKSRQTALNMINDPLQPQQKLIFEHTLFTSVMDSLPASVFFEDTEGRLVSANKAMEKLCNARSGSLIGKTAFDLFEKEDAGKISQHDRKLMQDGRPVQTEQRIADRWFLIIKAPRFDESGKLAGTYGVLWDITDRKDAENEIEDLARFPEENTNPVLRVSSDGELMYHNNAGKELLQVLFTFNTNHLTDIWLKRIKKCLKQKNPMHRSFSVGNQTFTATIVPFETYGYLNIYAHNSTHRLAAEQRMAESRNRFATLLSNLPGMAYRCGNEPSRTMEFVSAGCFALTGYTAQELTDSGRIAYRELIHSDDRERVWEHVQSSLEQKEHCEIEYRIIHRDGTEHWVWERSIGRTEPGADSIIHEGFIADITDRKQAEIALRLSTEQWKITLNSIGDGLISTDTDGYIISMNPVAQALTGWGIEEAAGRPLQKVFRIIHEKTRKPMKTPVQRVLESNEIIKLANHTLLISRDGRETPIADSAAPIRDKDDRITGVVMVLSDQTKERKARSALQESEEKYRSLFDNMTSGFALHEMIYDHAGNPVDYRFLKVNPAFEKLTGLTAEQTVGHTVKEIMPGTEQHWIDAYGKVSQSGEPTNFENYSEPLGKYYEIRAFCPAPGQFAVVFSDTTERKHLQEALEKRVLALTRPLSTHTEISFEELFSVPEIQRIQDEFAAATNTASIITRPDGTPITQPSNFTDLCKMIRKTGRGIKNCMESNAEVGCSNADGSIVRKCLSGGLWDAGAKIKVGGNHIANWKICQVRDETQNDEQMHAYAREIGVDEAAFMEAFHQIPTMSRKHFEEIARSLFTLTRQLSNSAYKNLQQSRFIAEQKEAERKLKRLSEEQSLILNNSMLGIALIRHRVFEWANPRLAEMLNLKMSKIQNQSTRILYPTQDVYEQVGEESYRTLGKGERFDTTLEFKHADGSLLWCRLIGIAIDPDHPENGSIWLIEDITKQKQTTEKLQRLSIAIEHSPEAIVITDTGGTIQYVNPAFETITGYVREEALGSNPKVLKSGVQDDTFYSALWETVASGQVWEGRFVNKHKDGTHFTEEASIAPVKDAQGRITNYVAVKRDISAELVREEEFRQRQKMEAIGLLAGGIAHDFNNILQGIMGFSSMLMNRLEPATRLHEHAHEIQKASIRAAELTQQLLSFSRKQSVQSTVLDINAVVNDMHALLEILLGESIRVELNLNDHLNMIRGDHGQLSQIIMNLAVNARDAMPEEGRLTISTQNGFFNKEEAAAMHDAQPGKHTCISIEDNGIGMNAKTLERLFEPFFTTKKIGKGSGLGLSVVYGIVKQSNGWIQVLSNPGKGSNFRIYFPAADDSAALADEQFEYGKTHARILMVDDDATILKMNKTILETALHEVQIANDAENALAFFEQESGKFDLVICDMVLPGKDGIELADLLRKKQPDLSVLLYSDSEKEQLRRDFLRDKGYNFIEKPFKIMTFLSAVQEALKSIDS